jgi:hypothetical protein
MPLDNARVMSAAGKLIMNPGTTVLSEMIEKSRFGPSNSALGFFLADQAHFRAQLNRASFAFAHRLSDHPLLQLPQLSRLARLLEPAGYFHYEERGEDGLESGWAPGAAEPRWPLEESVLRIGESCSWIILKHANQDPEYRELLTQCMLEIGQLSGWDLARETSAWEAQVMITSPRQVTAYHMDNECNFLLQVAGEKTINIFDQTDRAVLTEEELEDFWTGNQNAARYKPDLQERARVYQLAPGRAVHLPINAPHWLKNGDNISISLSVNCEIPGYTARRVFRVNHNLRKLGVTPLPPGRSMTRDAVKNVTVIGAGKVTKALKSFARSRRGTPGRR